MSARTVLHGVDFSGGRNPRRKIRVSTWREGEPAKLEGGISHAALVELIARSARDGLKHRWLVDSTFGLPLEMLETHGVECHWLSAARWMASFHDPREWRRACRKESRKELKRVTDRLAAVPFAPTNLRMFRQTWHCMVSVLLPLTEEREVAVLPFAALPGTPSEGPPPGSWSDLPVWVGEGCPASFLRQAGWPHRGYKGPSEKNLQVRREHLERLAKLLPIEIPPDVEALALEDTEGDALDSLLLLPSARAFATCDHEAILQKEPRAAVEGWVYVAPSDRPVGG